MSQTVNRDRIIFKKKKKKKLSVDVLVVQTKLKFLIQRNNFFLVFLTQVLQVTKNLLLLSSFWKTISISADTPRTKWYHSMCNYFLYINLLMSKTLRVFFSSIAAVARDSLLPQESKLLKVKWLSMSCKRTQGWNTAAVSRRSLLGTFICLKPRA